MTANEKAWELRTKLSALANDFKTLAIQIRNLKRGSVDARVEASSQADVVGCDLAALHSRMTIDDYDLFVDAARDRKDQSYAFPLPDGVSEDFADTAKRLRESAGLTIPDLARKSGISDDAIRLYEKGERSPTWDAVQKLATALGVSTDVFRDG